ncbi:MAG: 4Fe-4S dicluster domain-containing protein [Desulfobacterales bacterium]|nr:4Fe-4S dicluster domain-containing protein [Desulfobacterales bacterium]
MSEIIILKNSCKGIEDCGICMSVCPKNLFAPSHEMNERGFLPPRVIDEDPCTVCMNCMVSCPDMAIVVAKKKKTKEPK